MIFGFVNLADHLGPAFGRHIVWFFFSSDYLAGITMHFARENNFMRENQ
jgi:hypothetical protein